MFKVLGMGMHHDEAGQYEEQVHPSKSIGNQGIRVKAGHDRKIRNALPEMENHNPYGGDATYAS